MPKVVIIADDLTGANATAVLLAKRGFKAATYLSVEAYTPEEAVGLDVVAISTDSRAVARDRAYAAVSRVAGAFDADDVTLFCKRIDSTLRGNLGAEIGAVLDSLGSGSVAVVVPVFPSSGRVCIGDFLMVDHVPLERTDVARDPKTPVKTSRVTELIAGQTSEPVGHIDLGTVLRGEREIARALLEHSGSGMRVIVADATTDEDIEAIAGGVALSGLNAVSVDPGPFTAALAEKLLGASRTAAGKKVLLTIGSCSNLTRLQVGAMKVRYEPLLIEVDVARLIDEGAQDEIERVVALLLAGLPGSRVLGVVTTGDECGVLDLTAIATRLGVSEDDVSRRICEGQAAITRATLDRSDSAFGGLYTSGGDVTVAVCNALGASGFEVKDEVLPLAVYGSLIGGAFPGMAFITKGGLVGEENALVKCIDYLLTKVATETRTTTA